MAGQILGEPDQPQPMPVRDQDAALAYFTERLGFEVATDQPFDETQRWIELRIPGADTRLVLFTPEEHRNRIGTFSNIAFVADDVERTYRELRARGVEFTGPPQSAEWGTSAIIRDPDGNTFALSSK
jgi:catechol 2,3-dioxygenase-like lactoylglutathione lyase family enzyme